MPRHSACVMGLKSGTKLGEVEEALLLRCTMGRILAMERLEDGQFMVEFEAEGDATGCVGQHLINGQAAVVELLQGMSVAAMSASLGLALVSRSAPLLTAGAFEAWETDQTVFDDMVRGRGRGHRRNMTNQQRREWFTMKKAWCGMPPQLRLQHRR